MNILVLNYEYPPLGGGGGVANENLAVEWARQGHAVDVVTTWHKSLPRYEERNNVRIFRVKVMGRKDIPTASLASLLSFPFCAKKQVRLLFRQKKYDVINTHFAVPTGLLGIWTSKRYRIPNVLSLHGGDIYDPTKKTSPHRFGILKSVVRSVLNRSTAVVAQSQNTRSNTVNIYRPAKEISVIPLGYVFREKNAVLNNIFNISDDKFYLISIGRLVARKGFAYLVEAMKLLPEDIRLILIGDGPLEKELKDVAFRLGVAERIFFAGRASDDLKYAYLKKSKLYVLSSIHEGYGIVLQEAMEAGLPIVSTDNGGQTDFLVNGENALLVKPADSKQLADAILQFYNSADFRKKVADNNCLKIKNYSIEKIAESYLELFRSLYAAE